jgi:hypothetical protein
MLRKLALLAVALIAISQPLTSHAELPQSPRICDDVIPPDLKTGRGNQPPDEEDPGCPIWEGRPSYPYPLPPPCVPDAFTNICVLDP